MTDGCGGKGFGTWVRGSGGCDAKTPVRVLNIDWLVKNPHGYHLLNLYWADCKLILVVDFSSPPPKNLSSGESNSSDPLFHHPYRYRQWRVLSKSKHLQPLVIVYLILSCVNIVFDALFELNEVIFKQ